MPAEALLDNVREYMDALGANGHFHGVVLAAKQGDILFHEGYGMANAEHAIANSIDTVFRIGSLTKSFTAGAILRMHEIGLLCLNDPIVRYLPNYPHGEQVTIHQLLTHTAGVPNFTAVPEYWSMIMRLPSSIEETVAKFSKLALEFVPGSKFSYSNSGYLLLSCLIEKISGTPFADFMQKTVFGPLQLHSTRIDDGRRLIANRASGYTVNGDLLHADFVDMSFPAGAYGAVSTAQDLYRWDRAIVEGSFLSRESVKQMFTPDIGDYGYGWSIEQDAAGRGFVCHFGDINGFAADFIRYVAADVTVIVLSNFNLTPVTKISREIARLLFGEKVRMPVVSTRMELRGQHWGKYAGVYQTAEGEQQITVTCEAGGLLVQMAKRYGLSYKYRLVPVCIQEGSAVFRAELLDEEAVFILNSNLDVIELKYRDLFDNTYRYLRVE